MSIVTLTSDYGTKDFFVSAVKGKILSELDNVNIVDISHEITPFHLPECAYIVRNAYKNFPKNTVHIIAVVPQLASDKSPNAHELIETSDTEWISPIAGLISRYGPYFISIILRVWTRPRACKYSR